MDNADFEKFREGVAGVHAFYGKDLGSFALDVWWTALRGYDLAAVVQSFNRHLVNPDTGQFLPRPADIVKMLSGSTRDSALVAWSKVDRAVRQVGTGSTVVFDDPLIHRVIQDMGGWCIFGTKTEDEWPFTAKEFENRYRGYRMRSETPEYPQKLIGHYEAHNASKLLRIAPPVVIGDQDKAKAIMLNGVERPVLAISHVAQLTA